MAIQWAKLGTNRQIMTMSLAFLNDTYMSLSVSLQEPLQEVPSKKKPRRRQQVSLCLTDVSIETLTLTLIVVKI